MPDMTVPEGNTQFDFFQENLMNTAFQKHVEFGIPLSAFTEIVPYRQEWEFRWDVGKNINLRNHADVVGMQGARKGYEPKVRKFLNEHIRYNSHISEREFALMLVHVRKAKPSRNGVPDSSPRLSALPGVGRQLRVHFRQGFGEEGVSSKAKPKGVARVEIRYRYDKPPEFFDDYDEVLFSGSTPLVIDFDLPNLGRKVFFWARWVNTRNEPGPWCLYIMASVP